LARWERLPCTITNLLRYKLRQLFNARYKYIKENRSPWQIPRDKTKLGIGSPFQRILREHLDMYDMITSTSNRGCLMSKSMS